MNQARAAGGAARSSGRLGLTLRSVLASPREGFGAALRIADRRRRAQQSVPEGIAPYILSAVAGSATFLLWLKLGALIGLRDATTDPRVGGYIAIAAVLGAALALAAQLLWGVVGPRVVAMLGGKADPPALRLVWGAAGFPQVFALAILLPVDLVIVGPEIFTSQRLPDAVGTVWAALSVAVWVSLSVWSLFLFVRGTEVAATIDARRSVVASLAAAMCAAVIVGALSLVAVAVVGG